MALLSSCWFIIQSIIIQHGFLKWSFMNLYINPLILFLCQVLLWFNLLYQWLLKPFRVFSNMCLSVFVMFSKLLLCFLWFLGSKVMRVNFRQEINTTVNVENFRRIHNSAHVVHSYSFFSVPPVTYKLKVLQEHDGEISGEKEDFFFEFEDNDVIELLVEDEDEMNIEENDELCYGGIGTQFFSKIEDLEFECRAEPTDQRKEKNIEKYENSSIEDEEDIVILNEHLSSTLVSQLSSSENDVDSNDQPSFSVFSSDLTAEDLVQIENSNLTERDEHETDDEFYEKYCEKMRWYDTLNQDRTYGLGAILNQKATRSLRSWDKTAEKRLLESIEKDLELVYVAQSCLSWEALHHQYTKVRDIAESVNPEGRFYNDSSEDFQKFQVLLDRFLEDERCGEKRVMSFVKRRFELMSFLQVPKLSGYREGGTEEPTERKGVGAREVLKAIEKCIETFYEFVKVDAKRPLWSKLKSSLRSDPLVEVEDPRDIKLFVALTNSLHDKEQRLKEIEGKNKKSRLKRKSKANSMEECEQEEMLVLVQFTMIDLKLVSRVLQMSLVSSSHLKWCQDRLDNIHFKDGKISRTCSSFLFPSS